MRSQSPAGRGSRKRLAVPCGLLGDAEIPVHVNRRVGDGVGRVGDIWLSPPHYIKNNYISYGLWGVGVLDARYRVLPQDKILDEAFDPYTLLKNAYLQRRQYLVTDGKVSDKDLNSDLHAKADYRAHLITVMARRAVEAALK